ncbi:MAG TPA: ROK family protein [Pyrinomonadaceae bacterium]|nr:ROK family protein [Pyrinomonadaceae bacterium]
MNKEIIAGIDIGGTKIAVALADTAGQLLSITRFPTRLETGPHSILNEAVREIERMSRELGARPAVVGIGCGGPLDRRRGLILSPPNLPGWDEFPVVEVVESALGVSAVLDNDANASALGEHRHGAGRGFSNLVYITISTGIGGGIILGGELFYGLGDGAGEVGHIPVLLDGGPQCGCGARGCLESLCSGTSIARRTRELLHAGGQSSLLSYRPEEITAKMVAEAASVGDPLAQNVWDETIRYLAHGLSSVIVTLAPEAIILGGGVASAGEQLLAPLRRLLSERVRILPVEEVQILQASLGGDSGIHGALILGERALAL